MKKILTNTLVLCLITLVAGLSLAFVYEMTKAPIAEAQEKAVQTAYKAVFEQASAFEMMEMAEVELPDTYTSDINEIAAAKHGETTLGYVLKVTSHNGYGGDITIAMGVDLEGSITGVSVITQGETAGLGAKCKSEEFLSQFVGLGKEGDVTYVKTQPVSDGSIQAISGATISTTAVLDCVNTGLAYARLVGSGEVTA